jgi:hypothetical protein
MQQINRIYKLYGLHPVVCSIVMRIGPSTQHKEGYLQGGDKTDVVVSLIFIYCKQVYATCFL